MKSNENCPVVTEKEHCDEFLVVACAPKAFSSIGIMGRLGSEFEAAVESFLTQMSKMTSDFLDGFTSFTHGFNPPVTATRM